MRGTTLGAAWGAQSAKSCAAVLEHAACKLKVMKYYSSGADLAKDMGVPLSVIEKAHEDHFQAAKKTETHPNDGPYPAYPSGKCWDEARYHNFSRK